MGVENEGSGMDFLDSGMEEIAAGIEETGAGGDDSAQGTGSTPSPDLAAAASGGTGEPSPAGATPTVNPWEVAPKSWKQELHQHWATLNPDVRKYIHEREKQALDGLMQYKEQADGWNGTIAPFKEWIDHYKMQPQDVVQRMMNAHLTLAYGKPEQKMQIARNLLKDYGLEELLTQATAGGSAAPSADPTAAVKQLLQPIQEQVAELRQRDEQAQRAKIQGEVDAFLADAKNEYASELLPDMVKLINRGLASDLKSAYEQACRLNPEVSQKIIQRQIEEATRPKRPGQRNVTSNPVPPAPTATVERSIEEDMSEIFDSIQKR